jgi:predicted P-loop ATPase
MSNDPPPPDPWQSATWFQVCAEYRKRTRLDPRKPPRPWMPGTEPMAIKLQKRRQQQQQATQAHWTPMGQQQHQQRRKQLEPPPTLQGDPGPEPLTGIVLDVPWERLLHRNDKGNAISNLANALIALRNAPEWKARFSYDEMKRLIRYDTRRDGTRDGLRLKTDADVFSLQNWLQHCGMTSMARQTCFDAIHLDAHDRPYNAVRDYLENLEWDGEPRVKTWLTTYLGVHGNEYTDTIGKMFLVGMVARILSPGCKNDYMLVLEGPQGLLKSSACEILAGEYFSDGMPDISGGKDAVLHLAGKWLVEIGELSAVLKAESSALKAFLTRRIERYRPPFERSEVEEPRTTVFIGTTNESSYLRDPTGGRRFWPVRVGSIDLETLARDRDQLLAEAVQLFRSGAHWWPDAKFEREHIKPEQELRRAVDAWEAEIETHLKEQIAKKTHYVTLAGIAQSVFRIESKDFGTATQRRIREVLELQGWERDESKDPATNRARWRAPGVLPL